MLIYFLPYAFRHRYKKYNSNTIEVHAVRFPSELNLSLLQRDFSACPCARTDCGVVHHRGVWGKTVEGPVFTGGGAAALRSDESVKGLKAHVIGLPALKNNRKPSKPRSPEELVENLSSLSWYRIPASAPAPAFFVRVTKPPPSPSTPFPSPFPPRLFSFNLVHYPRPAPSASLTDQANRISPTGRNFTRSLSDDPDYCPHEPGNLLSTLLYRLISSLLRICAVRSR